MPSAVPKRGWRRVTSTQWFIIAMVLGVVLGWLFPAASQQLQIVSNIFLRLIKCIVVPLIFSTLVVGIAGQGGGMKVVGWR